MAKKNGAAARVKRERVPILLRLEPGLAEWLAAVASEAGRSRTVLVEMWLAALREALAEADEEADAPDDLVEGLGLTLVTRLAGLGVGGAFLRHALKNGGQ